jgi:TonB-linked SusC/RagA family outer membrane protein
MEKTISTIRSGGWEKTFKALLFMKLTVLFLFLGLVQGFGKAYSQNTEVTVSLHNVRLSKALSVIERESHYRFLYNNNEVKGTQKVSVRATKEPVPQLLDRLLAHTDLTYKILANNLIVIAPHPASIVLQKLTGSVTDSTGQPLVGVTIKVKGTSLGTVTDAQGNFSLEVPDNAILVVSYIGYNTKEVPVNGETTIHIMLSQGTTGLDQVVVIGYGTQKKRDLTGSIAVINGDEIAKMPSTNPVSSLQGKVAGLTIVNSGMAGAAPTVRIRGVNSTNNSDPLYVVDGILQTNIDYLNPADIATIEVLKDPSSIAIYGLQGGNGVIIITTKHAKAGETRINFTSSYSLQKVTNKIKVVDATGFKKLFSEQLANVGAPPFDYTNYTANTNWQDLILQTAPQSDNSLSISTATDRSSTYINLGYSDQKGVVKTDQYQKYVARLREEIHITKDINIGTDLTGYHYVQNPPPGIDNLMNKALWAAPIVPVKAGPGLYYSMPSFQRAQVGNPVALIDDNRGNQINKGYRFTGSIFAEIHFLKHFAWRSSFYTDLTFNNSRGYTPLPFHYIDLGEGNVSTDTSYTVNPHTSVNQTQSLFKTFQQDHTLTYTNDFAEVHHVTAMLGFTTLYHYTENISGIRTDTSLNIPDDPTLWYLNIAQASNPGVFGGGAAEDASMSFMARVNYSYKGKYLLNLTYRRDGTSKFSPDHQWGNFGSVGAGWVLTEEPFMQNISWLDFLKLKASWGTVGNGLNIGNYLSYPALNNANVGIFGSNVYPSVAAAYVPDPNLHWETVEGRDAGFESRLFGHRLSLNADFYDRKTHNILTTITLPGASGNTNYFTNLGTIDNQGIEITAGWNDKIGKDFTYSLSGNFSINKNKVESIGNNINFQLIGNSGVNMTQTGYSIGYFYGYVQTGIYQSTAQIDKSPHLSSAAPGDIAFKDVTGDGKITPADRTYLGTPFPKYNFGGSVILGYKNFDFELDLQGVAGNKIYIQRRTATFATLNYEVNRLQAWTGPGTTNVEPILDATRSNNYLFSNYWLEPGDYLRLRTLQLGYTFYPHILTGAKGTQSLRVYLSGQNLVTLTHATGYTPEVPISNPIAAGADNGVYPLPAIYTLGVNLSF